MAQLEPAWSSGELLSKARRDAQISTERMALALGVSRKTVNNYENDRTHPPRAALMVWAQITDAAWLIPDSVLGSLGQRTLPFPRESTERPVVNIRSRLVS